MIRRRVVVRIRPCSPAAFIITAAFVVAAWAACYAYCFLLANLA